MTRRIVLIGTLAMMVATALVAQGRWEVLGKRNVRDRLDHDTIVVGRKEGTFNAIKIDVGRRGVNFDRVVIHFANGGDQQVAMRSSIPAHGETRVIDIEGRNRVIRSIDFWYDAKSLGRGGSSTVRVLGRK
jgi:hypothetical protein